MAEPLRPLLDADDTLCENNFFVEYLIEEFIDYVDHSALTPAVIRGELDQIDMRKIKENRYDSEHHTTAESYESLRKRPATPA